MSTLAEIEDAVKQLPPAKQMELLYFLTQRLGETDIPLPEPRDFSPAQLEKWMDEDEAAMHRFREQA